VLFTKSGKRAEAKYSHVLSKMKFNIQLKHFSFNSEVTCVATGKIRSIEESMGIELSTFRFVA
jgi:hypothetical protein